MNHFVTATVAALFMAFGAAASAQTTTAFTYQGELQNAGNPAQGPHDLTFQLWDAPAGGAQHGSTVSVPSVPVTDGRFTVALDFGSNALAGDRWLQIGVEGTALSPRQALTPSPYSVQTRGIFVDDAGDIGIGTNTPHADLHVLGDAAEFRIQDEIDPDSYTLLRDTLPTQFQLLKVVGSGNAFLDIEPILADGVGQGLIRFFRGTDTTGIKRANFYRGDGTTALSAAIGVDGSDSFFQTDGGSLGIGTSGPTAMLDVAGDARIRGLLGVGTVPSGLSQINVADTGAPFGMSIESSDGVLPTILASNNGSGPVLWAQGTDDAALAGGGLIVAGFDTGANIAIDANEIMARNDGSPSTLFLNNDGGQVKMGEHGIHAAWAYGYILSNATIVSRSSNVLAVSNPEPGTFEITFSEPLHSTDILIVTVRNVISDPVAVAASYNSNNDRMTVRTSDDSDRSFYFVIFRP